MATSGRRNVKDARAAEPRASDTARRRRAVAIAGAALVVALLAILWLLRRPEPRWRLAVESNESEALPWSTIRLHASIDPPAALQEPEKWKWTWKADGTAFSHEPSAVEWKSDALGVHELVVDVQSPWGTTKSASTTMTIRLRAFNSAKGKVAPPPFAAPVPPEAPLPYGIADVWVEKDHVCQGEPSRIRVTPFDKRGEKEWLTAAINGHQGWEVPYVVPLMPPGLQEVSISVGDPRGGGIVTTTAYIEVDDCVAPFPIFMEHAPIAPDQNDIAFRATLLNGAAWQVWNKDSGGSPAPKAKAAAYRWSFGDGAQQATKVAEVDHRYPDEFDRPAERASFYSAKVEAFDASGASMGVAYDGVVLLNPLQTLRKEHGIIQLVSIRHPESLNPDGSRTAQITLMNIDASESARLKTMSFESVPCNDKEPTPRGGVLSDVFSDTLIAPRKGTISGHFTVSQEELEAADICWVRGAIKGVSEPGGLAVTGSFYMDTGKSTQNFKELSHEEEISLEQAQGPEKTQAMARAIQLLGHTRAHNPEDLRRLEEEGKIPRGLLTRDRFAVNH